MPSKVKRRLSAQGRPWIHRHRDLRAKPTCSSKLEEACAWRRPLTKFRPTVGYKGDAVPLAVGQWYNFHDFGRRLGNAGFNVSNDKITQRMGVGPETRGCLRKPNVKASRDTKKDDLDGDYIVECFIPAWKGAKDDEACC